ncbi:unnamed protein product [Ceratitis capitata]|uniref:(Mediterranean fruit fly) hypothetical protein n=1 Tax=Ceratitis capitata TaxID=7213 RepID=A0A811UHE1_CERCA|nr:unnamed protein product [Ceratitis capitata]
MSLDPDLISTSHLTAFPSSPVSPLDGLYNFDLVSRHNNNNSFNPTQKCEGIKYWTDDFDYDGTIDRAHFQQQLDTLPGRMRSFDWAHKCPLSPPALLTYHNIIPSAAQFSSGTILLKAELKLKQYIEFTCPFPGRNVKTQFRQVELHSNTSHFNLHDYQFHLYLSNLKRIPHIFNSLKKKYIYRREPGSSLRIQLDLDVLQVPARYHLSVWERLGQFWLYFASFFGILFT